MLRRRYEILLPLQYNDGSPIPFDDLNQTRKDPIRVSVLRLWEGRVCLCHSTPR